MLTFVMSNHHLLMLSQSPPNLVCVAASSSHPYILGVYFMSHHIMSQYSIHICIPSILCCPFWPPVILPPSPPKLSQSLPNQPCALCSDKGSHLFVPEYHFFHYPWCQSISHITIFSHALVEDPHCLTYGGPYYVDITTSIPEEWPRGWCILVLASTLVWCLRSSKENYHFPLT